MEFKKIIKTFFIAVAIFASANFALASDVNITEDTNFIIDSVTLVVKAISGAELFVVNDSSIDITFAPGDVVTIDSPSLRPISNTNSALVTASACTASASNVTLTATDATTTIITLGAGSCGPSCGDASCNGVETCSTCPADCGVCGGGGGGDTGDTTPPVISGGAPTGVLPIGTTQTTLSVTTDESATCKYSGSMGTSYASMADTFSATGGTNHSQLITGLADGSIRNYYVRCMDSLNNDNTSDYPILFSVNAPGLDTQNPTLPISLTTTVISDNQINLSWASSTDNISVTGYYVYRGGVQLTSTPNIFYQDTGLTPGTTYNYYVVAYDPSGNRSASSTASTNTTSSAPVICTTFTYSSWGTCAPSNTQTRTVTSSLPSGCTGGSPVTAQSCVYVIPEPPLPPPPPSCGDSTCSSPTETCSNCSADCGACPPVVVPPPPVTPPPPGGGTGGGISCGDRVCNGGETCLTCSLDCGSCEGPGGVTPTTTETEEEPDGFTDQIGNVAENIAKGISSFTGSITKTISNISPQQVKEVAQKTKDIAGEPTAQVAAEAVVGAATAVAVTQGLLGTIFTQIPAFSDVLLIVVRGLGLIAEFLGIKKRTKKWGVVYDAQTKRPLDPAYVTIYDAQGKELESKVTDMDGRFGFLVGSGAYKMIAHKTNYAFPASSIAGTSDELYDPIYKGELIEINNPDILKLNIPMDPVGVDWNEEIKKKIMSFNPKKEIFFKRASGFLFWLGLILSPIIYWSLPSKLNLVILVTYLVLAGLRTVGFKAKNYGRIYDKATGKPIPFAKIKVLLRIPGLPEQRLLTAVTDVTGRYYILVVGKGDYVLNISGTTIDGRPVTTEVPVNVKERVINFDLSV